MGFEEESRTTLVKPSDKTLGIANPKEISIHEKRNQGKEHHAMTTKHEKSIQRLFNNKRNINMYETRLKGKQEQR